MNAYSELKYERNRWREVFPVKYTPSKFPDNLYQQSGQWIKCCSDCTPNSNVLYESKEKNYYFVNLLDTKTFRFDPIAYYVKENWIRCSNSTTTDRDNGSLAVAERSILSNQNLREFVDYNVREASGANKAKLAKIITDKIRHHLASILGRLSSCHSDYTLKLSLLVLRTVLKLCFSQILCYSVHLSGLRKAQTKQLPLVYVLDSEEPTLSSVILQLTLISNGFKPASLFLPTTQSVSLLDTLIQRVLGYFGFRRVDQRMLIASMLLDQSRQDRDERSSLFQQELEGDSSTDDTILYRQALLAYLQETMKNEEAICMTVQDFSLDLITKLIETETVHDALVVPVSICYELTSSYSYLSNELRINDSSSVSSVSSSSSKTTNTLQRIVQRSANLVKFLSSRFCRWLPLFRSDAYTSGQVRVNFGQAYSLKEFIETKMSKRNYSMAAALTHRAQQPPRVVVDYYTRRAIESELRMHLKYDINQSGSVMCTNITAFVLLNNYPTGCCTSTTLTQRFAEIKKALAVNHQIGFLAKTDQDAVNYSLHLLKPYLTIEQQQQQEANNETRSCLVIKPRDASSACILFKHGRVVGRAFFLQSVLACAINSKLNGDGGSLSHHLMMRSSPIVYEHDIMKRCFEIIRLFQYEFDTYKKPCEPINTRLVNILSSHEMLAPSSRSMQRSKYSSNFGFDEHSDDEDTQQTPGGRSSARLASPPLTSEPFDLSHIYTENLVDNREMDQWAALDPTYKSYLLNLSSTGLSDLKYFVKILQPYVHIYQHTIKMLKDLEVGRLYADNELLDLIQSHPSQSKSDTPKLDIGDYQLQVESLDYFVRCRLISKLDSARCSAINATTATGNPAVNVQSAYTYRLDQEQRARLDQLDMMLSSIF